MPEHLEPGIGTIVAIEGLVELGMTPSEAIVAATKHGAMACKASMTSGRWKWGSSPTSSCSEPTPWRTSPNIRQLEVVMKEGEIIDIDNLPTNPLTGEW